MENLSHVSAYHMLWDMSSLFDAERQPRQTSELAVQALLMAIWRRKPTFSAEANASSAVPAMSTNGNDSLSAEQMFNHSDFSYLLTI